MFFNFFLLFQVITMSKGLLLMCCRFGAFFEWDY